MIDWVNKNKKYLSIRAIEQEIGMPDGILTKALNDTQKLSKKWVKPLNKFILELRK